MGRLAERGMQVPPAFVVTTDALVRTIESAAIRPFCERAATELASGDGERAREAGRAAAEALRRAPLSTDLKRAVSAAYGELLRRPVHERSGTGGAHVFAVRSSAVGEDAADRSHAGQFESLLNLGRLESIHDGIREVWASWYSDRAIGYRLGIRGSAPANRESVLPDGPVIPPMAVIVQKMVVPRTSGMLFTVNPVTGARTEMALEAGPGLGEALAQGRVHPDFFLVERERGGRLRISERGVAAKDRTLMPLPPGSGELVFRPLPAKDRRRPCVSDDEILAICRLGIEAEEEVGAPVDIEWTIDGRGNLHLLQARPVTALRTPSRPALRDRPVLWTQRFSGERWTELATPLGWSIVQPVLHWFTYWQRASDGWLDGTLPTRLYRGRPYINVTIFRHLSFRLPGGSPPQFLLEMFPPAEQEELKRGPHLPNLRLVGSILSQVVLEKRWKRYRYNFLTNHREWEEFRPGFEARIAALPTDARTVDDAMAAVGDARRSMVEYMSIHLLSLLFAHLTYEALDQALRSWVGVEGEAIRSALVADPADNRTLQANKALWELACAASRTPRIEAALCQTPIPDPDEIFDLPGGDDFRRAFDEFLGRFGHRSQASYEIFATRWADSPELVLRMLAGYVRGGLGEGPAEVESRRARERAQAETLVRNRMARTWTRRLFPWRQAVFGELLHLARRYMALRENQRFAFDRLLLRMKRIFERLGALMEREGLLEHGDDIVFLEVERVEALAEGRLRPDEAAGIVATRRAEFEANRALVHPDFLEADRHVTAPTPAQRGRVLHGLGISPGTARGTVRVLRSFDEMEKLRPGDVLVARATDPGWTPLFLVASALILELGSVLSHGAVVAREYGLPAVVNVEGATRLLQDGQEVTVDGERGRVVVHRAGMDPATTAREVISVGER